MNADVICKVGVSGEFQRWLDGDVGRRLFFIEEDERKLKEYVPHSRSRVFFLESPLQRDGIAKKIGWLSAFKKLEVIGDEWKELIEWYHLGAHAVASEASDFGVTLMRHLKANFQHKIRSLSALKGTMKGVPAVICGAGPSLEKNGHLLQEWKEKVLLIAAGNAIQVMPIEPDLAIAFDPHIPLVRQRYFNVPLVMQSRMHPNSWEGITGEALYFSENNYPFEPWLTQSKDNIDAGFTAGNAGVSIAEHLGCDPIILMGMDYCYQGERKYAGQSNEGTSPLVRVLDREGKEVWTQKDWLLAIRWLEDFARKSASRCWNATAEGMEIKGFGQVQNFSGRKPNVKELIAAAPFVTVTAERMSEWRGEVMRELLLEPLWEVWAPLFERELMADSAPLQLEEKMAIQKLLFFDLVMQEHLHA